MSTWIECRHPNWPGQAIVTTPLGLPALLMRYPGLLVEVMYR